MIRLVAKHHPHLIHWSREYEMRADKLLFGKPDYLFSYRENIKEIMYGMPLVCVFENPITKIGKEFSKTIFLLAILPS
jgi:hypothetical protein